MDVHGVVSLGHVYRPLTVFDMYGAYGSYGYQRSSVGKAPVRTDRADRVELFGTALRVAHGEVTRTGAGSYSVGEEIRDGHSIPSKYRT
jgi:hypothetical protein